MFLAKEKGGFIMDNVIDFNSYKSNKSNSSSNPNVLGTVTISILSDNSMPLPYFYILPDSKELLPLVDLLDETLSNVSIRGLL